MIIIEEGQLEQFVKELDALKPQSFPIFKLAENHLLKNSFAWPGIQFVVDRFPNFTACIVGPKPDTEDYVPRWEHYVYNALATNLDNFKQLIEEPGFINWDRACYFEEIPANLLEILEEVFDRHGETIGPKQRADLTTTGWTAKPADVVAALKRMPPGFTVRPLAREEMKVVHDLWDYGGRSPETLKYLYYLYDHHFPSTGIYTDDNKLIGFNITGDDMSLGAGYMLPEYRGRGLHNLVGAGICRQMMDIGQETVFAFVYEGNTASQKSATKGGAMKDDTWKLVYVLYKPKVVAADDGMIKWFNDYLRFTGQELLKV
ncbi:glycine N-acyltransferase-like protein 3 [Paramacrobiotus metropolitanus]|uniref:glycine N-acyltransferase-like protein 3 n=1 Tax=Paramacrobiotus metropolitanus TaxID=2943436 RepID=UPI002445E953|nr:glycine N-acyltransferase-like protein 3 [Paramacrobiotus metropolitanus]